MRGVWIQGAGELASGVTLALLDAGYAVLMAERASPLAVRRLVCFSEAVYAGRATVAGRPGVLLEATSARYGRDPVPVIVDPAAARLAVVPAVAVVDARMTKAPPVALPRGEAPLIGLGPGFTAGVDCDLVVETHRPAGPGRLVTAGSAMADTGVPGEVGGRTSQRLLRAPASGRLRPLKSIGDLVTAGEAVAEVAGRPVVAAIDGLLRGLVHPLAELSPGDKVGDVDPRGAAVDPAAVSDKAKAVGRGVVEALAQLGIGPAA